MLAGKIEVCATRVVMRDVVCKMTEMNKEVSDGDVINPLKSTENENRTWIGHLGLQRFAVNENVDGACEVLNVVESDVVVEFVSDVVSIVDVVTSEVPLVDVVTGVVLKDPDSGMLVNVDVASSVVIVDVDIAVVMMVALCVTGVAVTVVVDGTEEFAVAVLTVGVVAVPIGVVVVDVIAVVAVTVDVVEEKEELAVEVVWPGELVVVRSVVVVLAAGVVVELNGGHNICCRMTVMFARMESSAVRKWKVCLDGGWLAMSSSWVTLTALPTPMTKTSARAWIERTMVWEPGGIVRVAAAVSTMTTAAPPRKPYGKDVLSN